MPAHQSAAVDRGERRGSALALPSRVTSVLIVDDEPAVRDLMARWVTALGLQPKTAADAHEALDKLREQHYDLAVIDVMIPGRDGLWLAGELRRDHPNTAVILATGCTELVEDAKRAAPGDEEPIADFLVKPFQRERFALAVDRGRQWRKTAVEALQWHALLWNELYDRLDHIVAALAAARRRGFGDDAALAGIMAERVPDVAAHGRRVADRSVTIARELRLDAQAVARVEAAALFHDAGKAAMPDALLTKPSPLTAGERGIMDRHAEVGSAILAATRTLDDVAPVVGATHEWFGGGGYPANLSGAAIPFGARIIAVADACDAMTTDRAYRQAFDLVDAVAEILRCCPAQFDPDVVAAFVSVLGRE